MACSLSLRSPAIFLVLVLSVAAAVGALAAREPFRASEIQQGLCNMTQSELKECKPAITATPGTNTAATPTTACCAGLAHADMKCICSYKNSGWLRILRIDPDLAMKLPGECNLPAPNC